MKLQQQSGFKQKMHLIKLNLQLDSSKEEESAKFAAYELLYNALAECRINPSPPGESQAGGSIVIEANFNYVTDFVRLEAYLFDTKIGMKQPGTQSLKNLLKSDLKQAPEVQALITQEGDTFENNVTNQETPGAPKVPTPEKTEIPPAPQNETKEELDYSQQREKFGHIFKKYQEKYAATNTVATEACDKLLEEIDVIAESMPERKPELVKIMTNTQVMLEYALDDRDNCFKGKYDLHVKKFNCTEMARDLQQHYPVLRTLASIVISLASAIGAAATTAVVMHPAGAFAASVITGGSCFYKAYSGGIKTSVENCRHEVAAAEHMQTVADNIAY